MLEMFTILSNDSITTLQNVYTPFPMGMHLIFCIAATIVYGLQFLNKKSLHYLLLLFACDATFVTQINTSKPVITGLFVAEVLLLAGAAVFSFKYSKKLKAAEAEKKKAPKENGDTVDNAFED